MKRFLAVMVVLGLVMSFAFAAAQAEKAETYPTKNIRVIVPFSPGGPTDLSVRSLLDSTHGATFAVENVVGGAGIVGLTKVATSPADGYTLGCVPVDLAINYVLGKTDISPLDFIPLACAIADPYTLVVKADAPYNTIEEFVNYVKANPGKVIIGDTGGGSAPNVCAIAVADFFGLDCKFVSYDGSADCVNAIAGGHIQGTFTQMAPAKGQLLAGNLKAIACVANNKMSAWPNIPTIKESYPDIDFEVAGWVFVCAYKGTDKAKCDYLEKILYEASASNEFQAKLANLGMSNVVMTRAEAEEYIKGQIKFYEKILSGHLNK